MSDLSEITLRKVQNSYCIPVSMQHTQSQLPLPGQFAVQKPDVKLTTNIKTIMKDNRPETAAQFLSQKSKKKLSLGKSTPYANRAVSSLPKVSDTSVDKQKVQLVPFREFQRKEKGEELKKTSYLVKSRGNINRYSSGYRGIKL